MKENYVIPNMEIIVLECTGAITTSMVEDETEMVPMNLL